MPVGAPSGAGIRHPGVFHRLGAGRGTDRFLPMTRGSAMRLFKTVQGWYHKAVGWLDPTKPLIDLGLRLWVADAFFRAGLVKIANMDSTIDLFTNTYQVPVLPPVVA